jgi:hypothetical protein
VADDERLHGRGYDPALRVMYRLRQSFAVVTDGAESALGCVRWPQPSGMVRDLA